MCEIITSYSYNGLKSHKFSQLECTQRGSLAEDELSTYLLHGIVSRLYQHPVSGEYKAEVFTLQLVRQVKAIIILDEC